MDRLYLHEQVRAWRAKLEKLLAEGDSLRTKGASALSRRADEEAAQVAEHIERLRALLYE